MTIWKENHTVFLKCFIKGLPHKYTYNAKCKWKVVPYSRRILPRWLSYIMQYANTIFIISWNIYNHLNRPEYFYQGIIMITYRTIWMLVKSPLSRFMETFEQFLNLISLWKVCEKFIIGIKNNVSKIYFVRS